MNAAVPAVLGGAPVFAEAIPLTRPTLHLDDGLYVQLRRVLESGQLTNGSQVEAFEREVADFLSVEHVVAVSNCTTGLMLVLRVLNLAGELVLPSFTFMASGHAALWNGLDLFFADVNAETCTVDPQSVAESVGSRTAAIMAVHTFGAPCAMEALAKIADAHRIPLLVDAAHGFGGRYEDGSRIGSKGLVEVFSLSPTKPFSTAEGGIVATNDAGLARDLRLARNYGNPGSYDSVLLGLNARLVEFSAVLGRYGLPCVPEWVQQRQQLADRYRRNLRDVPGLGFQRIEKGACSTYKDMCLIIDPELFGMTRDSAARALERENIPSRPYFSPPLHRQSLYKRYANSSPGPLSRTEWLASRVLTVPMSSHLRDSEVDAVCHALRRIQNHAAAVQAQLDPP